MTSAIKLARYSLLAAFVSVGVIGITDGRAQTNGAPQADAGQADVQLVDRGKMRLQLLLSLVKNELRAASVEKTQLVSEKIQLARERAELSSIGDRRRPADNVRLGQIEHRLETIDQEMTVIDGRLPEIANEFDELQRRLDDANGIVHEVAVDTGVNGAVQANGTTLSGGTNASIWLDGKRQIQEALVYLGGYNALIDGDFGPRTAQAIKVYQGRQSLEETGVLTKEQETTLLDEATSQRSLYGVEVINDLEFGYRLSYPTLLLSKNEKVSASERRMTTTDGLSELLITVIDGAEDMTSLYEDIATQYDVQYRRKQDDWFVVAGLLDGDHIVYDTVQRTDDKLVRARLSYPVDQRDLWSPFAVILFNTFSSLPAG